jgi:hypothetical protein
LAKFPRESGGLVKDLIHMFPLYWMLTTSQNAAQLNASIVSRPTATRPANTRPPLTATAILETVLAVSASRLDPLSRS